MHQNLERRFLDLTVALSRLNMARRAFKSRFSMLFDALAEDLGKTGLELANMMGWGDVPAIGNKIMRGEAEPSDVDVARLLGIWEESQR